MGFFAFEEWAAANRNYDDTPAPYWHVNSVPNGFTAISGILWSISYILMTKKAFKDRSYAMPLHCLCLNITLGSGLRVCLRPGAAKSACFRAMDDFRRRSLLRNSSIGPVRLEAVTAGGTTSRGYNRSWVRGLSVATPSDRSHVYPENWSEGRVYDRMAHAGPYQSKLDSTATVAWKHPRSLLGDLVS